MSAYAKGTKVPASRTRAELERLLEQYRATRTGIATEPGQAIVYFELGGVRVQFLLRLPTEEAYSRLTAAQRRSRMEQRTREAWRALFLAIKAKLVSVVSGIESFEEAFLAHIVVPGGTVGTHVLPMVDEAYRTGQFLLSAGEVRDA